MGNSYTAGMPELVADIAKSMGDSLYHVDGSGGQSIKDHATSQHSLAEISSNNWDYVVLQCQSQEAAFNPTYVNQNVFPYAKVLADSVNRSGICTKPIFYMTWGRKNGDSRNCQYYSPLCSFETMQMELRKNYLKMGFDNDGWVSPVGMAWRHARKKWPNIELYDTDESHPSQEGIYLTACTFYAVIFGKSPVGSTFTNQLNGTDADSLQKAANFIVFDSLKTWNISYDTAWNSVSFNTSHDTVDFKSTNLNLDSVVWHFGDGQTSSMNNPRHVYSKADTFMVAIQSFKGCLITDTTFQVITTKYEPPNNVSVNEFLHDLFKVFPNPTDGRITIEWDKNDNDIVQFALISIQGKEVYTSEIIGNQKIINLEGLEPGLYYYTIELNDGASYYGPLIMK
tara:strand:- start:18889 stop:20079 length:1191 start_codon:yes stop_codon:yes gene_type:complete